jgi:hypothetical protein
LDWPGLDCTGLVSPDQILGRGARVTSRSDSRRAPPCSRRLLQRCHVDDEAVLHVTLGKPLVRVVDLLDLDDLDVRRDSLVRAEIEHLLRLADPADSRACQAVAPEQQIECGDRKRLRRSAYQRQRAFKLQQREIGIDVVLGRGRVQNEN